MRPVCHRTRLPARRTYPSTASGRCSTRRRIHCLTWSDAEKMADSEVYRRPIPNKTPAVPVYPNPDWDRVCREFAKTDVTLKLLRSENAKAAAAAGETAMPYDRFYKHYGEFADRRSIVSRVGHKAGRNMEADWSGPTMALVGPVTDEVSKVNLFVLYPQPVQLLRANARHEAGYLAALPCAHP